MEFGGITLGGELGGINLVNKPASSLPQKLASAICCLNGIMGATYDPLWYIGNQIVNGENFYLVCREVRMTKGRDQMIVVVVINVPPGEGSEQGEGAHIVRVIEQMDLPEQAPHGFDVMTKSLVGCTYKPIMLIGEQVVKGVNYFVLTEVRPLYHKNVPPVAAIASFNVFQDNVTALGMTPILSTELSTDKNVLLGAPLGEWP